MTIVTSESGDAYAEYMREYKREWMRAKRKRPRTKRPLLDPKEHARHAIACRWKHKRKLRVAA